jgi:tetratricopeptide (TPR) repeat protein
MHDLTVFRTADFIVRRVPASGRRTCFVAFSSFTDVEHLDRAGFGEAFLHDMGFDAFHVINRTNLWFHYSEMPEALDLIAKAVQGYEQVITYGSSMGGYAAIRFASAIGAKTAIAISPQYGVTAESSPFEYRWQDFSKLVRHADFPPHHGSAHVTPYIFFDPADLDRAHFQQIAMAYPLTTGLPLTHAGHPAGAFMSETHLLKPAVMEIVNGDFNASTFLAEARRRRRQSGQYFFTLARRLAGWHMAWKLQLAQNSVAAHDDAEYRRYLALLYDISKNYPAAEHQYRIAIAMLPDNSSLLRSLATFLLRQRRYKEAEQVARQIVTLTPSSREAVSLHLLTTAAMQMDYKSEKSLPNSTFSVRRHFARAKYSIIQTAYRHAADVLVAKWIVERAERAFQIEPIFEMKDEWLDRQRRNTRLQRNRPA